MAISSAVADGIGLAHSLGDCRITVHEAATGKKVMAFASDPPASVLTFSPDGKLLATATGPNVLAWAGLFHLGDTSLRLWDVRTGKQLAQVDGHRGMVTGLAFSSDGRELYSASTDGTLMAWDVRRLLMIGRTSGGR